MKSYLWTVALLLAAVAGSLTLTGPASAAPTVQELQEALEKQQEVRDAQIKYGSIGVAALLLAVFAFWALNTANREKKRYVEALRKQEQLSPDDNTLYS